MAKAAAPLLSSAFVNEKCDFFNKTLRGVQQLKPRWKRCAALVDNQLGEALGQELVRRAFSPALKGTTLRMTKQIEDAMAKDIEQLDWMSSATKEQALTKLRASSTRSAIPTSGATIAR